MDLYDAQRPGESPRDWALGIIRDSMASEGKEKQGKKEISRDEKQGLARVSYDTLQSKNKFGLYN